MKPNPPTPIDNLLLVAHPPCLVDLDLPEPGLLLYAREDLDGHVLAAPLAPVHLPEPLTLIFCNITGR